MWDQADTDQRWPSRRHPEILPRTAPCSHAIRANSPPRASGSRERSGLGRDPLATARSTRCKTRTTAPSANCRVKASAPLESDSETHVQGWGAGEAAIRHCHHVQHATPTCTSVRVYVRSWYECLQSNQGVHMALNIVRKHTSWRTAPARFRCFKESCRFRFVVEYLK